MTNGTQQNQGYYTSYTEETVTTIKNGNAAPVKPTKAPTAPKTTTPTPVSETPTNAPTDVPQTAAPVQTEPVSTVPSATEKEVVELRGDLQRLQAEYVNYRRRVDRDRDVARTSTLVSVFEKLLPTLDSIVAARKFGDLPEDSPFAKIASSLESVLSEMGLERVDSIGVEFDPTIHEAVLRNPSEEVPEDHISDVFREGYRMDDRVIRATQVMVSAGPA